MPYIIKFIYNGVLGDSYYGGKSYRYCGEKYAIICQKGEARRYKTVEAAKKAYYKRVIDSDNENSLGAYSCYNAPDYYVIEEVEE